MAVKKRIRKSASAAKMMLVRRRPPRVLVNTFNRIVRAVMSTRISQMSNPLRRSSLALHKMSMNVTGGGGNHGGGGHGVNSHANNASSSSSVMSSHKRPHGGHDGFDELRTYIKQGSEFTKELAQTLNERAELEATYAKGLAKLSGKLFKASKELHSGTVSNAWHFVAEDMEATAETHKSMAGLMHEDLVRPLRLFVETQHKTRKSLEAQVDKRSKTMQEWRAAVSKAKGKCYQSCRENERVQDQVLDCKLGRGRVLSDKELAKLQAKRKKSEEQVRKSDLDYYACCLKAERARLEWESSVLRGCALFRQMEEERLDQLKCLGEHYHQTMSVYRPKLVASSQRLQEPIRKCNVQRDMEVISKRIDVDPDSMGDQVLPNFYAEDQTNAMNQERRRDALTKFLRVIKSDIEREKKGKAGVENLAKALHETPKFGGEDSQQDVQEKLQHMRSMLTFLEACRFKVLNSLLDMEGRPRACHPLSSYIENNKDKSGMTRSVLKLPYWSRQESQPSLDEYACDSVVASPSSSSIHALQQYRAASAASIAAGALDRGTADGGFTDLTVCNRDAFTTVAVLESSRAGPDRDSAVPSAASSPRGMADGGAADDVNHDDVDSDSDFDDFSDGDEHVNIIEVVNGPPVDVSTNTAVGAAAPALSSVSTTSVASSASSSDHGRTAAATVTSALPAASQENEISEIYYQEKQVASVGQCRAIYDYAANMYDELTIQVGDVINIHDKQADGWWLGECNGTIGIFPATYVKEE